MRKSYIKYLPFGEIKITKNALTNLADVRSFEWLNRHWNISDKEMKSQLKNPLPVCDQAWLFHGHIFKVPNIEQSGVSNKNRICALRAAFTYAIARVCV